VTTHARTRAQSAGSEATGGFTWGRFYLHFASCYGTIWLVIMVVAMIAQTHVDAGLFGLIGFPIIAAIYGAVRANKPSAEHMEIDRLRRQVDHREHVS